MTTASVSGEVVRRYFACLHAEDIDGLSALYADEAQFILPVGTFYSGKEAILAMHSEAFKACWPKPRPQFILAGKSAAAVECETLLDAGVRFTANIYRLDPEHSIRSVNVYMRG